MAPKTLSLPADRTSGPSSLPGKDQWEEPGYRLTSSDLRNSNDEKSEFCHQHIEPVGNQSFTVFLIEDSDRETRMKLYLQRKFLLISISSILTAPLDESGKETEVLSDNPLVFPLLQDE